MRFEVHRPVLRLASALGCLLVLGACGAGGGHPSSPDTPGIGPVVVDLDGFRAAPVDQADLPLGAAPKVPWGEGTVLHTRAGDVPVGPASRPLGLDSLVLPFGPGALRMVTTAPLSPESPTLEILDADGRVVRTVVASDPVASPDRRRVAWWDHQAQALVVAATRTGREVTRFPGPQEWATLSPKVRSHLSVTVVGWLGPDDVLVTWSATVAGGATRAGAWRTSGAAVPSWFDPERVEAAYSQAAGLALHRSRPAHVGANPDGTCLDAVDTDTGTQRWRHCYQHAGQTYGVGRPVFSPDGRHVVVAAVNGTAGDPGYLLSLDAATGRVSAEFPTGLQEGDRWGYPNELVQPVFEDGEHFVALLANRAHRNGEPIARTTQAIVRCDVDGGCELATPPVRYRDDGMAPTQAPYWLY